MDTTIASTPNENDLAVTRRKTAGTPTRVLILWPHVPAYLAACVKSLLRDQGAEVCLIVDGVDAWPNHSELLSFPAFRFLAPPTVSSESEPAMKAVIDEFHPDIVLAGCGKWGLRSRLAKQAMRHGALAIWAADNYWRGSWRDYANLLLSRLGLIYSSFDAVWVPGSLGWEYARKMGFREREIFEGVYCCNTELLLAIGESRFRSDQTGKWPARFLFIGQYIERKNLAALVKAYQEYRVRVADPWELWCAGHGPLKSLLQNKPGIVDHGYRDAKGCARLMSEAGVFVIPSWVDHWPLVVHEATSAGLPVLASYGSGSAVELVRDGYNGYKFPAGDAGALSRLMQHISQNINLVQFGQNSMKMSCQFSPSLWCSTLTRDIPTRIGRRPGKAGGTERRIRSEALQ